jgi:type II secretory pathway predicted ATPase ExeA
VLNVCYAVESGWSEFRPLELAYQGQFCLSPDHVVCPTYLYSLVVAHRGGSVRPEGHLRFFGLREEPFFIVPQSRFLCESEGQKKAHTGLRWLIDQHHGLGLLFGVVGTGKTLLCHTLSEELNSDPHYASALLLTPNHHSEYALMAELLAQWHVTPRRARSTGSLEAAAHEFLVDTALTRKKTAVLIVDEAQTLPARLLQQVCKLLNWQDDGQQLLQVILAGQPSLERALTRVPALRDRVVVEFTLTAMTLPETQRVIGERLQRAGRRGDLFAPSAVGLIYEATSGMPRQVTILCLKCLWMAYLRGERYITKEVVQAVVKESGGDLFALSHSSVARLAEGSSAAERQSLSRLRALLWRLRGRAPH